MSKQKKTKNVSIEALKTTLKKKKESSAKALCIVEGCIEGVVTQDDLLNNIYYINQDHFQDIIEERAILKNCGYPLCANTLKDIPSKQFHISTQLNKVFDITDRKNFCSNLCYKAARYLKDQLLTSPLWLRNEKDSFHIKLLSLDKTQGSSGIEVDLGHQCRAKPEPEREFTSVLNFTTKSLSRLSEKVDKFEEKREGSVVKESRQNNNVDQQKQDTTITNDNTTDGLRDNVISIDSNTLQDKSSEEMLQINKGVKEKLENQCNEDNAYKMDPSVNNCCDQKLVENCDYNAVVGNESSNVCNEKQTEETYKLEEIGNLKQACELPDENNYNREIQTGSVTNLVEMTKLTEKTRKKESNKKGKTKANKKIPSMMNIVTRIEQCLREWCTIDTLCYVFGEEKVKEMLRDKGESIKEYQTMVGGAPSDPHLYERYLMICRKLNVLEFGDSKFDADVKDEHKGPQKPLPDYSVLKEEANNIEVKVKSFYQGDKTVRFKEDTDVKEDDRPSVIPLVDLHAQKALRRRIVLDRLSRVLSDLGQTLGLRNCYLTQDVRLLVSTFNLSASNIMFKPMEWNLIALAIFKLLSIKNTLLGELLNSDISSKNLTLLLLSYQLDGGYLERLAVWLTDIDYVLRNKS